MVRVLGNPPVRESYGLQVVDEGEEEVGVREGAEAPSGGLDPLPVVVHAAIPTVLRLCGFKKQGKDV
ncbi:MAG: hypothetical protein H5T34_03985 [Candidatus Methanomethyliales bacterium]|nr:hypothetical protein [Candidatus Methanomethylicales archaeon]